MPESSRDSLLETHQRRKTETVCSRGTAPQLLCRRKQKRHWAVQSLASYRQLPDLTRNDTFNPKHTHGRAVRGGCRLPVATRADSYCFDEAEQQVRGGSEFVAGLRLSMLASAGAHELIPCLAPFFAKHPRLKPQEASIALEAAPLRLPRAKSLREPTQAQASGGLTLLINEAPGHGRGRYKPPAVAANLLLEKRLCWSPPGHAAASRDPGGERLSVTTVIKSSQIESILSISPGI